VQLRSCGKPACNVVPGDTFDTGIAGCCSSGAWICHVGGKCKIIFDFVLGVEPLLMPTRLRENQKERDEFCCSFGPAPWGKDTAM
jgi:hypothetical protein